jgi:hypothetical protein
MAKKKTVLREELVEAGISYTGNRPMKRFMHGIREVDLEKSSLNRIMAAAKDPNCNVVGFTPPKGAAKAERPKQGKS